VQLRPALLGLQHRRLPLAGQILEAVRLEQRLLELPPLLFVNVTQRRKCDDLPTRRLSSALAIGAGQTARQGRPGGAWAVLGGQQNAAKSKLTFERAPFKNVVTLICRSVVPLPG
jgi:hypothetical protein